MIGSLFSGYSGLDIAAQTVFDMPIGFVSDIDPGPCKVLAQRHPDAPNLGDITRIDWAPWRGQISVLTGGFPCTDVSLSGQRAGLIRDGGTRSGLWSEMHRAIVELQPEIVIIENVKGLLSAKANSDVEQCPWCVGDRGPSVLRALGAVLGDLADAGYDARWRGLRAADVGACHSRYRVFIVAYPAADAARDGWDEGLTEPAGLDLRPAISLLPTPQVVDGGGGQPVQKRTAGGHQTGLRDIAMTPPAWSDYAAAIARHTEVFGRPAPLATVITKNGPRLSPKFVEWMMMLPDGWVTDVPGLTRSAQLRLLGNGVVPAQAESAIRYLSSARAAPQ